VITNGRPLHFDDHFVGPYREWTEQDLVRTTHVVSSHPNQVSPRAGPRLVPKDASCGRTTRWTESRQSALDPIVSSVRTLGFALTHPCHMVLFSGGLVLDAIGEALATVERTGSGGKRRSCSVRIMSTWIAMLWAVQGERDVALQLARTGPWRREGWAAAVVHRLTPGAAFISLRFRNKRIRAFADGIPGILFRISLVSLPKDNLVWPPIPTSNRSSKPTNARF
jgi:hypothetical protein